MSIYLFKSESEFHSFNKSMSEIFDIEYIHQEYNPEEYIYIPFNNKSYSGEYNGFYGKSHTEEYKQERSELMLGNSHSKGHISTSETIEKLRLSRMGYTHNVETKKKIGESNKGKRKGLNLTEEWRQNIIESCGAKKVMGPDGTIYDSIRGAAKLLNTYPATIKNRAGKELFGWKFVEE